MISTRRLLLASILIGLATALPARANGPGIPADHPLAVRLAASSVTRGREHRALLVYPIVADSADPATVARPLTSREAAKDDMLSVGEPDKKAGRETVEVFNWSTDPVFLLAGEVLEGGIRDRFLAGDVLLGPGHRAVARVLPADGVPRRKDEQGIVLEPWGAIALDVMRLAGVSDAGPEPAVRALDFQFGLLGLKGVRHSITELFSAPATKARTAEYATLYEAIPDESAKKAIGAAVWVGEHLVGVDLFPTNSAFRAHWPVLIRTYAAQAAIYEAGHGLLKQLFPVARDPDRHALAVKDLLKKAFAARARSLKAADLGEETLLTRDEMVGRVLTHEDRLVHAVLLLRSTDGSAPLPPPPGSNSGEFSLGELERRAERGTLTEYEKRLLERRRALRQKPPKPTPPKPAPPIPTPGGGDNPLDPGP